MQIKDLAEWLERLTASAEVASVLGSFPASSDTYESERRQMKQCWIQYITVQKNIPVKMQIMLKCHISVLYFKTCPPLRPPPSAWSHYPKNIYVPVRAPPPYPSSCGLKRIHHPQLPLVKGKVSQTSYPEPLFSSCRLRPLSRVISFLWKFKYLVVFF